MIVHAHAAHCIYKVQKKGRYEVTRQLTTISANASAALVNYLCNDLDDSNKFPCVLKTQTLNLRRPTSDESMADCIPQIISRPRILRSQELLRTITVIAQRVQRSNVLSFTLTDSPSV